MKPCTSCLSKHFNSTSGASDGNASPHCLPGVASDRPAAGEELHRHRFRRSGAIDLADSLKSERPSETSKGVEKLVLLFSMLASSSGLTA